MSPSDISAELESFREQWRAEVRAKVPGSRSDVQRPAASTSASQRTLRTTEPSRKHEKEKKPLQQEEEDDDYVPQSRPFDEPEVEPTAESSSSTGGEMDELKGKEPVSALDHYEKAVEKEVVGNLGDSLRLYRQAFRMDHRVDLKYKNKHFPAPPPGSKPVQENPSNAPVTVPSTAHHSPDGRQPSMEELIASFAGFAIEARPAEIEGTPQPPCPIAGLPDEILIHILRDVAILDVGDFVRLAQVCRRLAYLVATEDRIWQRVCLGTEVGFGAMHYHWQRGVSWEPLDPDDDGPVALSSLSSGDLVLPLSAAELAARQREENEANTLGFLDALYSSSWQRMLRLRPRVRFNGCYISTVNYIRSGQASANLVTWNSPVHIVTYYRYLRFFRDGTAVSLLTTAEPADVVPHLTRDALALHAGGAMAHLPSAVMQSGLRGRWRLACAADAPEASVSEVEGDVFVETEGVGKYMYRLDLSLRSSGRGGGGPRNNKLVWRGFYSYDRLTDDWAEFRLRNDKPFFFSRVKSYGAGE